MAEETIVECLKREGQLTRNSGTNSIRSVKIELEKFNEVFDVISKNIIMQTEMMQASLGIQKEEIERSKRESDLKKLKDEEVAAQERRRERRVEVQGRGDTTGGLGSLFPLGLGAIGGLAAGGLGTLLLGGVLAAIAPAVGKLVGDFAMYAMEDLGFTSENAKAFGETLGKSAMFGTLGAVFGKKIALLFAGGSLLSDALDLSSIVTQIGEAFNIEMLQNPIVSEGIGTAIGAALIGLVGKRGGLRGILIGAIATALTVYGGEAAEWLKGQGVPESWADITVEAGTAMAQGAALGSIFGPYGILVGAVAGLAYSLGKRLYEWLTEKEGESKKQLEKDLKESDNIIQDPERRAKIEAQADEISEAAPFGLSPRSQGIAQQVQGQDRTRAEQLALESVMKDRKINELQESYNSLDEQLKSLESASGSPLPGKETEYNMLLDDYLAVGRQLVKLGQIPRTGQKLKGEEEFSYRRGTKGFQDFGDGSFAILHGREAVVPEMTPAGRFISQYFDENFEPKKASRYSEAASMVTGGSVNSVIINNSPTIAPNVNNVRGGPNISNTNMFGGSGGGGGSFSMNPYGLTNAIN